MTPDLARIQDNQTAVRAAPSWGGGDASRGTRGWYWDASGGFIPVTPDTWNPWVAFLVFPRITSSSRIERRETARFTARFQHGQPTVPAIHPICVGARWQFSPRRPGRGDDRRSGSPEFG